MDENLDLAFKGGNPGAVQFGNFINYYQFHPAEKRIKLLPTHIWPKQETFHVLDIGSNAGDLTVAVYDFLSKHTNQCSVLGIEIDPMLVQRSREKIRNENVEFHCLDIMKEESRSFLRDYLEHRNLRKFDAVFCFAVTMWIHLNHGDAGLGAFLSEVCQLGNLVIIEPQPWKCYRSAVKRLKLSNAQFPLFRSLNVTRQVNEEIVKIVQGCQLEKIFESELSEWGRKVQIFRNKTTAT